MSLKEQKICKRCQELISVDLFHKQKHTTKLGAVNTYISSDCMECRRAIKRMKWISGSDLERRRKHYVANKEAELERNRIYRINNREKVLRDKAIAQAIERVSITNISRENEIELINYVFDSYKVGDKYLDCYSGELIDKPTIEHVTPTSAGGMNTLENLCITSKSNNSKKYNKPLLIWMIQRGR